MDNSDIYWAPSIDTLDDTPRPAATRGQQVLSWAFTLTLVLVTAAATVLPLLKP